MKTRMLTVILTTLMLIGCSSQNDTPTAPPSPSETDGRTELVSFSIAEQEVAPNTYDQVKIPVELTIVTRQADEIILYSRTTGNGERIEIARLQASSATLVGNDQTFQYSWTPPADAFTSFIWAEANGDTGTSTSETYRLRFQR